MKVILLNLSGNVGKTTLARHLIYPRIPEAKLYRVETHNANDLHGVAVPAQAFRDLMEAVLITDQVIVDVGASNTAEFLRRMVQYRGSEADFDYFIVPTVPDSKQIADTVGTLAQLKAMQVDVARIRVLVNRVVHPETLETDLFPVRRATQEFGVPFGLQAYVSENELFAQLQTASTTVNEIANDPSDFRALISTAQDAESKLGYARQLANKRLAAGVEAELQDVYVSLFGSPM